jgi:type II secretory pathway component PulM
MSTLTDRARDFWERITPRERGLVMLFLVATPLTLALWLGFAIHDGLDAMAARNDKTRHALDVLADMRARGSAAAQVPVDDWVKGIPVEPLSLDTYVNKAAQKAGFTIAGTRPHANQTRNGFVTASVQLDVPAVPIDQLKTFLQTIESDSKYVAVTKLTIRRPHNKPEMVEADLDVSTYAKEKTDDAGSGAGASGSSTATGGSAKGGW